MRVSLRKKTSLQCVTVNREYLRPGMVYGKQSNHTTVEKTKKTKKTVAPIDSHVFRMRDILRLAI